MPDHTHTPQGTVNHDIFQDYKDDAHRTNGHHTAVRMNVHTSKIMNDKKPEMVYAGDSLMTELMGSNFSSSTYIVGIGFSDHNGKTKFSETNTSQRGQTYNKLGV